MRHAIFAFLAIAVVASSTGCCCLERFFCWGCRGPCAYGNEGPCNGGCGACGYGGSGCGCADCGYAGGSVAQGSGGAMMSQGGPMGSGGNPMYAGRAGCQNGNCSRGMGGPAMGGPGMGGQSVAGYHPANGHPFVKQRRDSDDTYEFAAGPPTGAVTYPYYTNRGPRDYLARNPRSIGP